MLVRGRGEGAGLLGVQLRPRRDLGVARRRHPCHRGGTVPPRGESKRRGSLFLSSSVYLTQDESSQGAVDRVVRESRGERGGGCRGGSFKDGFAVESRIGRGVRPPEANINETKATFQKIVTKKKISKKGCFDQEQNRKKRNTRYGCGILRMPARSQKQGTGEHEEDARRRMREEPAGAPN